MAHPADRFTAVVLGASSGGIDALSDVLSWIPQSYPLPIVAVL